MGMFTDREEPLTTDDIRLHLKKRILDDEATCHDQHLVNDTEIWVTVKADKGRDDFEEIDKVAG